jgi:hypothetical protein
MIAMAATVARGRLRPAPDVELAASALRKGPVTAGLRVLGDRGVQGNIKPMRPLTEPLQVANGNGAK